jgi:hypothetical protein
MYFSILAFYLFADLNQRLDNPALILFTFVQYHFFTKAAKPKNQSQFLNDC